MRAITLTLTLLLSGALTGCGGSYFRYRTNDAGIATVMQKVQSKTAEAVKCQPGQQAQKTVAAKTTKEVRNGKANTTYSGSLSAECR